MSVITKINIFECYSSTDAVQANCVRCIGYSGLRIQQAKYLASRSECCLQYHVHICESSNWPPQIVDVNREGQERANSERFPTEAKLAGRSENHNNQRRAARNFNKRRKPSL